MNEQMYERDTQPLSCIKECFVIMTPLIHLHGAIGAASQFQPLVHELHDFVNYSFDFEGHGSSAPTNRDFRIEFFAENLQNFIIHHKLFPARIVGYSMGGYVALWLASHEPELIHSVMTLGTKFNWTLESAKRETSMLNIEKMIEKVPTFTKELEARHHGSNWKIVIEKTKEMMNDLGSNPRLTSNEFAQIQCPVRIGVGDRDSMVSLEESHQAFKAISNAEFYVLPNTQHSLERVNTTRWSNVIRDFFLM